MLNIDLLNKCETRVLVSTTDITVSRIGEIILLSNSLSKVPLDARDPWEDLVISDEYFTSSGIYSKLLFGDQLSLVIKGYNKENIDRVCKLEKQEFSLAMIQNNPINAALCSGCKLCGTKIDDSEIRLAFNVIECEMIYNK